MRVMLLLSILLSSCFGVASDQQPIQAKDPTATINSKKIAAASKLCEKNGGVKLIYASPDGRIVCENGARFKR